MTLCYPDIMPRYFLMQVELSTPSNYSTYDFTSSNLAKAVMDAFAQEIVSSLLSANSNAAAQALSVSSPPSIDAAAQYGAMQKLNINQLSPTSTFVAIYTFNGTEDDLMDIVNLATTNCADLSNSGGCSACFRTTQWSLCDVFVSTAPSSQLYGVATFSIVPSSPELRPSIVGIHSFLHLA